MPFFDHRILNLHLSWDVHLSYKFPEAESSFAEIWGMNLCLYYPHCLALTKCPQHSVLKAWP